MIVALSVLLGAVFVVSAVMKLAAPQQWRGQAAELGVPPAVATVVPFAELLVGALLIAQLARHVVALVAGVMLVAFTGLLVVRLSQGRRPPCACFGAWSTKPIGWLDVVRNAVFVAVAVVVAIA
ncbi:MAG: MauE/DoxX family redox-associated membrane protein [Ilumatobacteraceae bacterium]